MIDLNALLVGLGLLFVVPVGTLVLIGWLIWRAIG
jgi:hypothetical protein